MCVCMYVCIMIYMNSFLEVSKDQLLASLYLEPLNKLSILMSISVTFFCQLQCTKRIFMSKVSFTYLFLFDQYVLKCARLLRFSIDQNDRKCKVGTVSNDKWILYWRIQGEEQERWAVGSVCGMERSKEVQKFQFINCRR